MSAKVLQLDDHRPKITAEQLIEQVLQVQTGPGADMFDAINLLPDIFDQTLRLIMVDFDYSKN